MLLFNWFFTEPFYTFKVNDLTYIITFAIMMLSSILTSALTTKVKKAAEDAREREKESNALYQMTNHLTDAIDTESIAKIIAKASGDVLKCSTAFISFDVVSALSTTGYSTMSYAEWPDFAIGVLILMMIIGGGIGSTAGGIKLSRVYLMLRLCALHIKKKLSPGSSVKAPAYIKADGKTPIDKDLADDTTGFVMAYLVIFAVGSLALTVTANCTLTEAMFDFASSLSTVGLSIGITGPHTNDATLIIEMIGMMLGRLEIFIVAIGFTFGFSALKAMFSKKA